MSGETLKSAQNPEKPNLSTSAAARAEKTYTESEMQAILADGYFSVPAQMWDYVPAGAHVRFVRNGEGTRAERFRAGGYVRSHFTSRDGRKILMLESNPGGNKSDAGYISFYVPYDDISELWKRYDKNAIIEIHMIFNSLAQKKRQVEDLNARVRQLEAVVESMRRAPQRTRQ